MIKCKCGWAEVTTGISSDLAHLHEIPNSCATCGKARIFKCVKCGGRAKMLHVNARRG